MRRKRFHSARNLCLGLRARAQTAPVYPRITRRDGGGVAAPYRWGGPNPQPGSDRVACPGCAGLAGPLPERRRSARVARSDGLPGECGRSGISAVASAQPRAGGALRDPAGGKGSARSGHHDGLVAGPGKAPPSGAAPHWARCAAANGSPGIPLSYVGPAPRQNPRRGAGGMAKTVDTPAQSPS